MNYQHDSVGRQLTLLRSMLLRLEELRWSVDGPDHEVILIAKVLKYWARDLLLDSRFRTIKSNGKNGRRSVTGLCISHGLEYTDRHSRAEVIKIPLESLRYDVALMCSKLLIRH